MGAGHAAETTAGSEASCQHHVAGPRLAHAVHRSDRSDESCGQGYVEGYSESEDESSDYSSDESDDESGDYSHSAPTCACQCVRCSDHCRSYDCVLGDRLLGLPPWASRAMRVVSDFIFWPFIGGIMYGVGEVAAREWLTRRRARRLLQAQTQPQSQSPPAAATVFSSSFL